MSRHLYPHVFGSGPTIVSPLSLRHYAKRMALPCGFTTMGDQGGSWTPTMQLEGYDPLLWLRADQGISTGGARQFYSADKTSMQHADNAFFSTGDITFYAAGYVWFDAVGSQQSIFSKWGDVTAEQEYLLAMESDSKLYASVRLAGGGTQINAATVSALSASRWYFVEFWHDATANTINIAIDNGSPVSTSTGGAISADGSTAFIMGARAVTATPRYAGVRLSRWSFLKSTAARAVIDSAATRTAMYNQGRGILSGNLDLLLADLGTFVAGTDWEAWNFNETDGTVDGRSFSGLNDISPTFGELSTNGTFASDTSWTKGTGWTIAAGVASCDGTQVADSDLEQAVSVATGHRYSISFTVSGYSAGNVCAVVGGTEGTDRAANGTFTETITVASTDSKIAIRADLDFVGSIDNVTCTALDVPSVDGPSSDIAPDTGSAGTNHGLLTGFSDSETARSTDTADGSPNPTVLNQVDETTYPGLMVGFAAPDTARSAHGLTGVPGQAITFDGTDDLVLIGGGVALGTTHTLMAWAKLDAGSMLFGGTGNNGYGIYEASGTIYYSTGGVNYAGFVHAIDSSNYHHYAVKRSGTTVSFFVDGVQVGTDQTLAVDTAWTLTSITSYSNNTGYIINGPIADPRIYSSALTAPQIAAIAAGDSGLTGSPVLRYDFNEADTRTLTTIGSGTSLVFDGVDDYVSCGSIGAVTAISLYVKQLVDDQQILTLANSTATAVTVADGVLTFGASLTASAITVDGVSVSAADAGATLNDNAWHLLAFSLTSISATGVKLGTDSSAYGQVMLDDVKFNAGALAYYTFDEQTSLSVTDGDPIAIAQSLEGSRYQFINATASERPDYVASAINGKPGLEFDGVDDLLEYVGVPLMGTAGTVIAICKVKAVPDAYQTLLASSDTATATKYMALHIRGNTANGHIGYGQNNAGTEDLLDGNTNVTDELDCAVYWASNGTTVTARLNGTAQTLTADTGANNGDWWDDSTGKDTTTIGALKHTSETNHAAIILCELICYPINLSDASRATVAAYILREYGLTL